MIKKNTAMSLAFGALNAADYITTRRILNTGGEELNPIAAFFIRKNHFGVFKAAATLAGMLAICTEKEPHLTGKVLLGLYGFVVAHNISEIVRHERETNAYAEI
ncbi:MAG: DUF5658 family protein [Thermodesulfobacteriota bacterium]